MQQKKAVGIWIRVSTDDQAKGESPEIHEQRARAYAESRDWVVRKVYHLEGLTGKSIMSYAETRRMMDDIQNGEISGLIFSKLARFARNTKEMLEMSDYFRQHEADLISLQEAIDTSSPAGRLFFTIIAAMAQWEREEIVDRVIASIPVRAKLGKHIGGQLSLGYRWNGTRGEAREIIIDEQFAPIRKLIYELFLKHKRKKTIAKTLNDMGYRTRDDKKFTDTTVTRLLRDPMAKGIRIANKTDSIGGKKNYGFKPVDQWVTLKCPAIVSEELWDECNQILDKIERKRTKVGPQVKTLLAGYVECTCGKKMYVYHQTNNPTYTCSKCKTRIPADDLDEIYRDQLKAFLLTETTTDQYLKKLNTDSREKENLLSLLQEERAKLKKKAGEMVDMRVNGEWNKEIFVEHFRPIEERMKQIDKQTPILQSEIDILKMQYVNGDVVLSDAKDLYSKWETLDFDQKRNIVDAITERIAIGKEDIHIKLAYVPIAHSAEPTPQSSPNGVKEQRDH